MPETIIRGENRLLSLPLRLVGGVTPLPYASLASASVAVMQGGRVKASFVAGAVDNVLRPGGAADEMIFELTTTLSAALKPGPVTLRCTLQVADAGFVADPALFTSITDLTPWSINA